MNVREELEISLRPTLGGGKLEEMVGAELRTGPVTITGADGHVGRHLQARLTALPNPVLLLNRHDEWEAGTKGAEAVVHLAGTLLPRPPDTYQSANADTVRRLAAALTDTVNKVVFLSYPGADPESDNPYLRAKGEAEELIRTTGVPWVIFRSSFVYGNPEDIGPSFASYQSRVGKAVSVLGDGTQRLAPIHVGDLTDMLIAAALTHRPRPEPSKWAGLTSSPSTISFGASTRRRQGSDTCPQPSPVSSPASPPA